MKPATTAHMPVVGICPEGYGPSEGALFDVKTRNQHDFPRGAEIGMWRAEVGSSDRTGLASLLTALAISAADLTGPVCSVRCMFASDPARLNTLSLERDLLGCKVGRGAA